MSTFWSLMITFWAYLPWVAVALMAALALRKRRESRSLLLQAAGASAMFLLAVLQWVIEWIFAITHLTAPVGTTTAPSNSRLVANEQAVFSFLFFLALAIFALGYCLERFKRRGEPAVKVTATPAP